MSPQLTCYYGLLFLSLFITLLAIPITVTIYCIFDNEDYYRIPLLIGVLSCIVFLILLIANYNGDEEIR